MPEDTSLLESPSFDVPTIEVMEGYLPQFKFEKLAACGGMGAVYRAYQESLDRRVAVKILPPEFGAEKDFANRFKIEARAMAKLNHTNIVGVYDFGMTAGGHLYLVMEWVEGQSLHHLIHGKGLSLRKATNLAMQLCEALTFAHDHQIIHRDIKPGNIMVNDSDHVKVGDFGLARLNMGEVEEENPMGTPDYAAPEIRGGSVVDYRVDIFAVGVVLYEMITGTVPTEPRKSVTEFVKVPARWDDIISRAMHPDPEKRFQDAAEFRAHINVAIKQITEREAPPMIEMSMSPVAAAAPSLAPQRPQPSPPRRQPSPAPPPSPKPEVRAAQKKQFVLVAAVVGVVLAAFLALFWPSSKRSAGVTASSDEVHEVMQKLERNDVELARLVNSFAEDWAATGAAKNPSSSVADKLREAQHATLLAKVRERADAARRAEILAAELVKLKTAPSLKALKQAASK